jgi:hypothetical protein
VAVSELLKQRSRAKHAAHQAYLAAAEPTTDFQPASRPTSKDYNLHATDIDGDADLEWEFTQLGLDISRGRLDGRLDEIIATGQRPA